MSHLAPQAQLNATPIDARSSRVMTDHMLRLLLASLLAAVTAIACQSEPPPTDGVGPASQRNDEAGESNAAKTSVEKLRAALVRQPVDHSPKLAFSASQGAVNERHGLALSYRDAAVVMAHDTGWQLALGTDGFRCGTDGLAAASPGRVGTDGNRLDFTQQVAGKTVLQWYLNKRAGLEQGWVVSQPLCDRDELIVEVALEGLKPELTTERAVLLREPQRNQPVAVYHKLLAYDANNDELPARFVVADNRVSIHVETSGATYPIVIDPVVAVEEDKITQGSWAANEAAGTAVAIDANTMVIGAPGGATGGTVYVFTRAGMTWTFSTSFQSNSPAASDEFGAALATDGTNLIVGAPGAGNAEIFTWGGPWTHVQTLSSSASGPNRFGDAVDISGNNAVVGDPTGSNGGTNEGYIEFFLLSGTWGTDGVLAGSANDILGRSVTVDNGGPLACAGAVPGEYVQCYVRTASWGTDGAAINPGGTSEFGYAVDLNVTKLVIGEPGAAGNSGQVHEYNRTAPATWTVNAPMVLSVTPGARLGESVAHNGSQMVAGAPGNQRIYTFSFTTVYEEGGTATGSDAGAGDNLGVSVAINSADPAIVVAGDSAEDLPASNAGAGYGFILLGGPGDGCVMNADCANNICSFDNVCCDDPCMGTCEACDLAGTEGTCTAVTPGNEDPDTCATPNQCTASQTCAQPDGSACMMNNECISDECGMPEMLCCTAPCGLCQECDGTGACVFVGEGVAHPDCPTTACDGAGACQLDLGDPGCTGDSDCFTSVCSVDGFCCDSVCDQACESCDGSGMCLPLSGAAPIDDPPLCTGTMACDDGGGNCLADIGEMCPGGDGDCANGQCVDGYCCDTACTGTCEACDIGGSLGTCTAVAAGNPDPGTCDAPNECTATQTCGQPDGSACVMNNECISDECGQPEGVCCTAACPGLCMECDGAGACNPVPEGTDPNGECPGTACDGAGGCQLTPGTACVADSDCFGSVCSDEDNICCDSECDQACEQCNGAGMCLPLSGAAPIDDPPMCTGTMACDDGGGNCLADIGEACLVPGDCANNLCVDGFCCDTMCNGTCERCDGTPGTCTADVPNGVQDPGTCDGALQACDGAGVCKGQIGAMCPGGDVECLNNQCRDGYCCDADCSTECFDCNVGGSEGTCMATPIGTDPNNDCPDGICDGICKNDDGTDCSALGAISCQSASCPMPEEVCCDTACDQPCEECGSNPGTCQIIPDGTNDPNGCAANTLCDGGTGAASCKLIDGEVCAVGSDCYSTNCPADDLVCCDAACNGVCQGCGGGTCVTYAAYTDPDTECAGNEQCDGAGACKLVNGEACGVDDSLCISGNCVDGVCCSVGSCPTCQTCQAGSGVCGNVPDMMDPKDDCEPGGECNGFGACYFSDGVACPTGADAECMSGNCADEPPGPGGICCSSPCDGGCEECSSVPGTCTAYAEGNDDEGYCAANVDPLAVCDGTGGNNCTGGPGFACAATPQCQTGFNCIDGVCCTSACTDICEECNATPGTCTAVPPGGTDPDPAANCEAPNACNGGTGAGACLLDEGQPCTLLDGSECASGNCVDGFCCDTTCDGTCLRCDLPTFEGTCSFVDFDDTDSNATVTCDTAPYDACDGAGNCVQRDGGACGVNGDCLNNACSPEGVCCDSLCNGDCEECPSGVCQLTTVGMPDPGPGPACLAPNVCDAAGDCLLGQGEACIADGECASGFCIDNFCCENACGGEMVDCLSCAAADQDPDGAQINGTCLPTPDFDDDGTCDIDDPDDDNDGVADGPDDDQFDESVCRDMDGDMCDDCVNGADGFDPSPNFDTSNDGTDTDSDGECDLGDDDDDGDGRLDVDDTADLDPFVCGNRDPVFFPLSDDDTCDDCTNSTGFGWGGADPFNDGPDDDGDGICNPDDVDADGDGRTSCAAPSPPACCDPDDSNFNMCGDCQDPLAAGTPNTGDGCDDCAGGGGVDPFMDDEGTGGATDVDDDGWCAGSGMNNPDQCDGNAAAWTANCTTCQDNDGDGRWGVCDVEGFATDDETDRAAAGAPNGGELDNCQDGPFPGIFIGAAWTPQACASCADKDSDGRVGHCDLGQDTGMRAAAGIPSGGDVDFCDEMLNPLGPDWHPSTSYVNAWSSIAVCGDCRDADGDGYWGDCDNTGTDRTTADPMVPFFVDCEDVGGGQDPGAFDACDDSNDNCRGGNDEYDVHSGNQPCIDTADCQANVIGSLVADVECRNNACVIPCDTNGDIDCDNIAGPGNTFCVDDPTIGEVCSTKRKWWPDDDGDTWGRRHVAGDETVADPGTVQCGSPPGPWVNRAGDCNDDNNRGIPGGLQSPDLPELCETEYPGGTFLTGIDDDCDCPIGTDTNGDMTECGDEDDKVDEAVGADDGTIAWWDRDLDGDGGNVTPGNNGPMGDMPDEPMCDDDTAPTNFPCWAFACGNNVPSGFSLNDLDCDDVDASSSQTAIEVCDNADNDCDGNIDEFLIDNNSLAELREDSLVLYFSFDNATPTDTAAIPSTGVYLNASTSNGGPDGIVVGKYGQAALMQSTDSRIRIQDSYNNQPIDLTLGGEYTIAFWVRWDGSGTWKAVVAEDEDWGPGEAGVLINPSNGQVYFQANGGNFVWATAAPNPFVVGEWVHVAVKSNASQLGTIHVNGSNLGASATLNSWPGNSLVVGQNGGTYPLEADIDELMIWRSALTDTEIRDLAENEPEDGAGERNFAGAGSSCNEGSGNQCNVNRGTCPANEYCSIWAGPLQDTLACVDDTDCLVTPGPGSECIMGFCSIGECRNFNDPTSSSLDQCRTTAAYYDPCPTHPNDYCNVVAFDGTNGQGVCQRTGECEFGATTTCTLGVLSCGGTPAPTAEDCDGLDDDCDGWTDDRYAGYRDPCMGIEFGSCGVEDSLTQCDTDAECTQPNEFCYLPDALSSFPNPTPEGVCMRVTASGSNTHADADCNLPNNTVDPPVVSVGPNKIAFCNSSGRCQLFGLCDEDGVVECVSVFGGGGNYEVCGQRPEQLGGATMFTDEVCDGSDNDCDGALDEANIGGPPLGSDCCTAEGTSTACHGCENSSDCTGDEECNFALEEDVNQDGMLDLVTEDLNGDMMENSGLCTQPGVCGVGRYVCDPGNGLQCEGLNLAVMTESPDPIDPSLCDNLDNDCDGSTDENITQECGQGTCSGDGMPCLDASDCAMGTCSGGPGFTCSNGGTCPGGTDAECDQTCDGGNACVVSGIAPPGTQSCAFGTFGACSARQPIPEDCNQTDDDCDGTVDEGLILACSNMCGSGIRVCTSSGFGPCSAPTPQNETCDGFDNDCDGDIDEMAGCGCTVSSTGGVVGGGMYDCSDPAGIGVNCDETFYFWAYPLENTDNSNPTDHEIKVVAYYDDTDITVTNLSTSTVVASTTGLDAGILWTSGDLEPDDKYKVYTTKPVVSWSHDDVAGAADDDIGSMYWTSIDGKRWGTEFYVYEEGNDAHNNPVTRIWGLPSNPSASTALTITPAPTVDPGSIPRGGFRVLQIPTKTLYHITSTEPIMIERATGDAYTAVPPADGYSADCRNDSGREFRFGIVSQNGGMVAVFNPGGSSADIDFYTVDSAGSVSNLISTSINPNEVWVPTQPQLATAGDTLGITVTDGPPVLVMAGDWESSATIDDIGDDITQTYGDGGRFYLTRVLTSPTVVFASDDGTVVNIDGVDNMLDADEFLTIPTSGMGDNVRIVANKPVIVQPATTKNGGDVGTHLVPVARFDRDGDGIPDAAEGGECDTIAPDSDGDNIPNYRDASDDTFTAVLSDQYTTGNAVQMTPVIANIRPADAAPEIAFVDATGRLVIYDPGGTSSTSTFNTLSPTAQIAVANIDEGDIALEIAAFDTSGQVRLFDASANEITGPTWTVYTPDVPAPDPNYGSLAVADIDGDGTPNVVACHFALEEDGTAIYDFSMDIADNSLVHSDFCTPEVIDVDGSPELEIFIGARAYHWDGGNWAVRWHQPSLWDPGMAGFGYYGGGVAVGNVGSRNENPPGTPDPDDSIDVFVTMNGVLYALAENVAAMPPNLGDINGQVDFPGTAGGAPTITDFDADGNREIGVGGGNRYTLYRPALSGTNVIFSQVFQWNLVNTMNSRLNATSIDLNGDGIPETVIRDEEGIKFLHVGSQTPIFDDPLTAGVPQAGMPIIGGFADSMADDRAQVIVPMGGGIYIYGSDSDETMNTWVEARQIWNQFGYHTSNIADNGTVPASDSLVLADPVSWRATPAVGLMTTSAPDLVATITDFAQGGAGGGATTRVTNGLQVLYDFKDGTEDSDRIVFDKSGVAPALNLQIVGDDECFEWRDDIGGGLEIDPKGGCDKGMFKVRTTAMADIVSKIHNPLVASREFTVEVWMSPDKDNPGGSKPKRIVTYSSDTSNRNFTFGQASDKEIEVRRRLRGATNANGTGGSAGTFLTDDTDPVIKNEQHHYVYTYESDGSETLYLDGVVHYSSSAPASPTSEAFDDWDNTYDFGLGNEMSDDDRMWEGDVFLVAVYDRALSAAEVDQNYNAGSGASLAICPAFSSIDVEVCNVGEVDVTDDVLVGVFYGDPALGDIAGDQTIFGGLAVDACSEITVDWISDRDGSTTITAAADYLDSITECNEGNNNDSQTADLETPSDEVCNGADDNCDGVTDNLNSYDCPAGCGSGTITCINGMIDTSDCDTMPEICDGMDNDCDGIADDSDACGEGFIDCVCDSMGMNCQCVAVEDAAGPSYCGEGCRRGEICTQLDGAYHCVPFCTQDSACPWGYRCNTTTSACEPKDEFGVYGTNTRYYWDEETGEHREGCSASMLSDDRGVGALGWLVLLASALALVFIRRR